MLDLTLGIEYSSKKAFSIGYNPDTQIEKVPELGLETYQGFEYGVEEDHQELFISVIVDYKIYLPKTGMYISLVDDTIYISSNKENIPPVSFPIDTSQEVTKIVADGGEVSYEGTFAEYINEDHQAAVEIEMCTDDLSKEHLQVEETLEKEVLQSHLLKGEDITILQWYKVPEMDVVTDIYMEKQPKQIFIQNRDFDIGENISKFEIHGDAKFLASFDEGKTWINPINKEEVDIKDFHIKMEVPEGEIPHRVLDERDREKIDSIWEQAADVKIQGKTEEFLEVLQANKKVRFLYILDKPSYLRKIIYERSNESKSTPVFISLKMEYQVFNPKEAEKLQEEEEEEENNIKE